jgi:glycosyltransferase involved in cell wall biosynthesis
MEYEHFGISIVEAMSAGCLPVVPDSGGPREYVPPNLRYRRIEEAAQIIERNIKDWSFENSKEMIKISNGFTDKEFKKKISREK